MTHLRSLAFVAFGAAALTSLAICGVLTPLFAGTVVVLGFIHSDSSFVDPQSLSILWSAVTVTFSQAFLSATICVLLALAVARFHYFVPSRVGNVLIKIAQIPFGMPSIIIVFGFILAFGNQGVVNRMLLPVFGAAGIEDGYFSFLYNFWAIVHAHIFFNFGMCARQIGLRYQGIPKEYWWSAESLNFTRGARILVVEIPHLKATLINLWLVVFGLSVTSFAIVLVLGGSPALSTLEVLVYQLIKYDADYKGAFAAALLQFILVFIVTLISQKFGRSQSGIASARVQSRNPSQFSPGASGLIRANWISVCGVSMLFLVLFWIAIPIVSLGIEGLRALHPGNFDFVTATLVPSFVTSMGIALPTAALATCFGLAAAQVTVRWRSAGGLLLHRTDRIADIVSISLLALSPTVLGFSLHASLGALGIRPFDHTYLGVIAIQSFLFTPLSFRIFYAALRERVLDWNAQYAALSLPLGMQTLVVEWRALWAHVCAVFMINVSFSVGEVVGPALFGDTTFRPLSLLLLELVGSYQFERAAIVTLLVLAIAFIAYAIGNRELQHARG
jgi:thiamine transport system permease protein